MFESAAKTPAPVRALLYSQAQDALLKAYGDIVQEMLAVDGLHAESEDRDADAAAAYERAMALFSLLEPGGAFLVGLPEAAERIQDLTARLVRLSNALGNGSPPA